MVPSKRFFFELQMLLRGQSAELKSVMPSWSLVSRTLDAERERLLRCLPKDDPIRAGSDLLSPLSYDNDEVTHTQAVAYLFDPRKPHGFRCAVLERFIIELRNSVDYRCRKVDDFLRLVRGKRTDLKVIPERRHLLADTRARKVPKTDIWIEIHTPYPKGLIVIENKISARESERQLEDYERVATDWCRRHRGCAALLVFLTVDGSNPESAGSDRWVSVSYSQLAHVLREVWMQNRQARAASWLELYIASIARNVLGLRVDNTDSVSIARLQEYVGVVKK